MKILATPDLVLEAFLPTYGDMADGIISTGNYSANHVSKLNDAFVKEVLKQDKGESPPDYNSVAVYDIMHAIYNVTAAQKGSLDPDRTMQLLAGMTFESPRGPLEIGKDSRDIVQTVYIRRTGKTQRSVRQRRDCRVPALNGSARSVIISRTAAMTAAYAGRR